MKLICAMVVVSAGLLFAACNGSPPEKASRVESAEEGKPSMTLESAAETARTTLRDLGYEADDMQMAGDEENTKWQQYIAKSPGVQESRLVKEMQLGEKRYWAIHFSPARKQKGGDAWVFVSRDTGDVIGLIRGK